MTFPKIPRYYEGELRYIRKFLWHARTLLNPDTGIHETRRLCFAIVIEERCERLNEHGVEYLAWREIAWAGKEINLR